MKIAFYAFRLRTCGHPCTNVPSTFSVGIAALIVPLTKILGSSECPSAYILAGISVPMYLPHLARVGIAALIVPSTKRLALVKRSFRVYTCGHPCTNVLSTFLRGHRCTYCAFNENSWLFQVSFRLYSCGHLCTNVPSTFSSCGHRCFLSSALKYAFRLRTRGCHWNYIPSAFLTCGHRCSRCALHSFEKTMALPKCLPPI